MELSRRTEELNRGIHTYAAQATSLQLLPKGSKNAKGIDFNIHVNSERLSTAASLADVLSTDIGGEIMPALTNFKTLVGRKCAELRKSAGLLQDQEERSGEATEDATDRLEQLQVRQRRERRSGVYLCVVCKGGGTQVIWVPRGPACAHCFCCCSCCCCSCCCCSCCCPKWCPLTPLSPG